MKRRMTREEFNQIYNVIWETGPTVRYLHPDSRLSIHDLGRLF